MKLVSFLNVSNPDALQADSGFVFQKLLLEELTSRGHRALLVAPAEAAKLTTVPVVPVAAPKTKYHARFGCDWPSVSSAMREHWAGTDALLVNQPETAATIKAMSVIEGKIDVPLLSYIHYLPLVNAPAEQARLDPSLADGGLGAWILGLVRAAVESSDACIVGSEFGRRLIEAHVGAARRLEVIPPPADALLARGRSVPPPGDTLRLLFNHRLYRHYGTAEVFAALDRVHSDGGDFEVVVTAPTQWRSSHRRILAPDAHTLLAALSARPYVRVESALDRADYRAVVTGVHAGLAPAREAPLWSMAIADLLTAGRPVYAPRAGGFSEVMTFCAEGLWDRPEELMELIHGAAVAPPQPQTALSDAALDLWSVAEIAGRFEELLRSLDVSGAS
jgi:hypothetical protein